MDSLDYSLIRGGFRVRGSGENWLVIHWEFAEEEDNWDGQEQVAWSLEVRMEVEALMR